MPTRRQLLQSGALLAAASSASVASRADAAPHQYRWDRSNSGAESPAGPFPPGRAGKDYKPVAVPDGATLPWKIVDGVKVYHLRCEQVDHEFAPPQPGLADGLCARCWGFNGAVNGPVIEAVEGDRVRVYATNNTPAPT